MAKNSLTAAGGVLWRQGTAGAEVLLVHRPDYDDWSIPKGKPDDGENPLQTAVREVGEETGLTFSVGPRLGRASYQVKDRTKVVTYWSMRLNDDHAEPAACDEDEVDDFAWLPVREASQRVSYEGDRKILRAFARVGTNPVSLILVRHGRAGSRSKWKGEDDERPLDKKGVKQSDALAQSLPWFDPTALVSAPPVRCTQTAQPFAEASGLELRTDQLISDHGWADEPDAAIAEISDLATAGDRIVAVSQGKVMQAALDELLPRRKRSYATKKGGMWVLTTRAGAIASSDYYPSLLPA